MVVLSPLSLLLSFGQVLVFFLDLVSLVAPVDVFFVFEARSPWVCDPMILSPDLSEDPRG